MEPAIRHRNSVAIRENLVARVQNQRAVSENSVFGADDHVFPPAKLLAAAANPVRATRDRMAPLHDLRKTASDHASLARDLFSAALKEIAEPNETVEQKSDSWAPFIATAPSKPGKRSD